MSIGASVWGGGHLSEGVFVRPQSYHDDVTMMTMMHLHFYFSFLLRTTKMSIENKIKNH